MNKLSLVLGLVTASPIFFSCNVGVRQGENLWPILFSIFLNDLTEFISHAYEGLNRISNMANLLLSDDDVEVILNFMYCSMRTILLSLPKMSVSYRLH